MHSVFAITAALAVATASPGFVALPIEKKVSTDAKAPGNNNLAAKLTTSPSPLINKYVMYLASFTLGNPPQQQQTILDTGSSDLWVYSSGAQYNFNPNKSTTAEYINSDFSIGYVGGNSASGDFYNDTLTWGGVSVKAEFAVDSTYSSSSSTGIFGISLPSIESAKNGYKYTNYPYALKNAGLIETAAYSLYLDDASASTGTILFGALDKSRFTGPLSVLPITSPTSFNVETTIYNRTLQATLDSGTSMSYLPDDLLEEIASDLGATYDASARAYAAPKEIPNKSITYTFGNTTITVPPSELWVGLSWGKASQYLTIFPASQVSNYVLLGDTFLRSAYVVYDIDSKSIGIAQANWSPGAPDYEVITSSGISA